MSVNSEIHYSVFRKTFHIPSEWMKSDNIKFLVEHKYAVSNVEKAFQEIHQKLKDEGYNRDNDTMVHDYLYYMIKDMLDKNKQIYITEKEIRESSDIKCLLLNTTPDFLIKSTNTDPDLLILDIYIGNKDISSIKSKYRAVGSLAKFCIITQYNFSSELLKVGILPQSDIDYIYKNYQIFITEYYYWKACLKLRKILMNYIDNIIIKPPVKEDIEHEVNKNLFRDSLISYSIKTNEKDWR